MNPTFRKGLILGGCVLLGALAVAGWMHKGTSPEQPYGQPAYPLAAQPASYGAADVNRPDCGDQTVYEQGSPYSPAVRRAVYRRPASQAGAPYTPRTRTYVRSRPFKNSLAIVAGSSGVGAAIGALAGGGRGAAIGALSGGAAGFIYDRVTHKKRVTVTE